MTSEEIEDALAKLKTLQSQIDQASGREQQLKHILKSNFGVSSLKAAIKKRGALATELAGLQEEAQDLLRRVEGLVE